MSLPSSIKYNQALRKVGYYLRRGQYFALLTCIGACTKVAPDKVLLSNFFGKGFGCNPRAIAEELHRQMPEMDLVWVCAGEEVRQSLPSFVRPVRPGSLRYFYEVATSGAWVDNLPVPRGTVKKKEQLYIQTYHGDRVPKKLHYQNVGKKVTDFKLAVTDKICDYGVTGSASGETVFREGLGFQGPLLKYGTPRCDCLVNLDREKCSEIRKQLSLEDTMGLLLYAPTFRQGEAKQTCTIDFDRILDMLEKKTGKPWRCLYRAHFHTAQLALPAGHGSRFLDVSRYPDMADLLMISDMLITDYSSSSGDFCLTGRPIVLFIDDEDQYTRPLHFRMEDTPYLVSHDQQELEEIISGLDEEKARQNCEALKQFWGIYETGHASEKAAEVILAHARKARR